MMRRLFFTLPMLSLFACDPAAPVPISTPGASGPCEDVELFVDEDGDGYGVEGETITACLGDGEEKAGYARVAGDCDPDDILSHPGSGGVCNDGVDDDCDGVDEACPQSQPAQMDVPSWDCTGAAPSNVYAWARIDDGAGFYDEGGCLIFFEGEPGSFYVKPTGVSPVVTDCEFAADEGCTCPNSVGPSEPSYDQRLYAFTTAGDPAACDPIVLPGAFSTVQQPVSNDCRRFLVPLFQPRSEIFFVAGSIDQLESRVASFPRIEFACAAAPDCEGADWATLFTMNITRNDGFARK